MLRRLLRSTDRAATQPALSYGKLLMATPGLQKTLPLMATSSCMATITRPKATNSTTVQLQRPVTAAEAIRKKKPMTTNTTASTPRASTTVVDSSNSSTPTETTAKGTSVALSPEEQAETNNDAPEATDGTSSTPTLPKYEPLTISWKPFSAQISDQMCAVSAEYGLTHPIWVSSAWVSSYNRHLAPSLPQTLDGRVPVLDTTLDKATVTVKYNAQEVSFFNAERLGVRLPWKMRQAPAAIKGGRLLSLISEAVTKEYKSDLWVKTYDLECVGLSLADDATPLPGTEGHNKALYNADHVAEGAEAAERAVFELSSLPLFYTSSHKVWSPNAQREFVNYVVANPSLKRTVDRYWVSQEWLNRNDIPPPSLAVAPHTMLSGSGEIMTLYNVGQLEGKHRGVAKQHLRETYKKHAERKPFPPQSTRHHPTSSLSSEIPQVESISF